MAKFKVMVSNVYYQEHIVEADDMDHAKEIGSEISMTMSANRDTHIESNWDALLVDESSDVTYTPVQEYLK